MKISISIYINDLVTKASPWGGFRSFCAFCEIPHQFRTNSAFCLLYDNSAIIPSNSAVRKPTQGEAFNKHIHPGSLVIYPDFAQF